MLCRMPCFVGQAGGSEALDCLLHEEGVVLSFASSVLASQLTSPEHPLLECPRHRSLGAHSPRERAGQQCRRLAESAGRLCSVNFCVCVFFPPCNLALERDLLIGIPS